MRRAIKPLALATLVGVACFLAVIFQGSNARSQGFIAELSKSDIPIEWNFTGASILLFGAIDKTISSSKKSDVIIVVQGPKQGVFARQKERIAGVWVNTRAKKYQDVPIYYSVVSTRPIQDISAETDLEHMGIGFKALALNLAQRNGEIKNGAPDQYSQAVVRLMKKEGLYQEKADGVKLIGNRLFRANIVLPSNVPVGKFVAQVYLFENKRLVTVKDLKLSIQKKGLERFVYSLAYGFPLLYGITAVIISVIAGLIASAIFRDD